MKKQETISALIKTCILSVLAVAFLLPLVWMVLSSFKATGEVFSADFHWLPRE